MKDKESGSQISEGFPSAVIKVHVGNTSHA